MNTTSIAGIAAQQQQPPTGAWVLWFAGDDPMSQYVEIHGSELEALRSALRDIGDAGTIMYSKPVVTFVPFGKSVADVIAGAAPATIVRAVS